MITSSALFMSGEHRFVDANNMVNIADIRGIAPEPIPLAELARNGLTAASRWAVAGFPLASLTVFSERAKACSECLDSQGVPVWSSEGIGHCRACGCTGLKRYLATERCPAGKW